MSESGSDPTGAPTVIGIGRTNRLLDDLNVRLERLYALEVSQVPKGENLNFDVSVTDKAAQINTAYLLPDGQKWYRPWISCDIINQGPSKVFYQVNNAMGRFEYSGIPQNTIKVVDLRVPKLTSLTLYCSAGLTATVTLIFQR